MSHLPFFSHVYIEKEALNHIGTISVLKKLGPREIIRISHYKDLFNRPRQDWEMQRKSRKLILALRKKDFLYPGAGVCDPCGGLNFHYTSLLMNCIYDCHYCYLQGLYPSANIVLFVNNSDFIEAARKKLQELGSLYLSLSYDSDLMALENLTGYCREWMDFARTQPSLLLEIRTKSTNGRMFQDIKPLSNIILAFTLSPQQIAESYEHRCPPPDKRLDAAEQLAERGWPIRLVIDPVLLVQGWKDLYAKLIEDVFRVISEDKVRDISVGSFRINEKFLKRIKTGGRHDSILYQDFQIKGGVASYQERDLQEMRKFFMERLSRYLPQSKIFLGVTEGPALTKSRTV